MTPDRPMTRITCSRLALGGDSVGYLPSGKVCFVRGAPLNELVSIDVVQEKRKFARGVLSEENHGEHCSSAAQCGGCPGTMPRHVQRDALREHTFVDCATLSGLRARFVMAGGFAIEEMASSRSISFS